jgi:CBS domain-containing protein
MTRVQDLMTREVFTVGPDTAFKDVVEALLRHDVSGLPVVDDEGRLLGIVTEADLVPTAAAAGGRCRSSSTSWAEMPAGRTRPPA